MYSANHDSASSTAKAQHLKGESNMENGKAAVYHAAKHLRRVSVGGKDDK